MRREGWPVGGSIHATLVRQKVKNRSAVFGVRTQDSGSPGQELMTARGRKRVVLSLDLEAAFMAAFVLYRFIRSVQGSMLFSVGRFSLTKKKDFFENMIKESV